MKLLVGFVLGVMVASATAQTLWPVAPSVSGGTLSVEQDDPAPAVMPLPRIDDPQPNSLLVTCTKLGDEALRQVRSVQWP